MRIFQEKYGIELADAETEEAGLRSLSLMALMTQLELRADNAGALIE